MNTRMAKERTTPMPTIVHTMLVRVGSTGGWGKGGSAVDGATTSGSGGTEPSGEGCSGTPASGRSALIVVPPRPVRDDRYRLNQPTPPTQATSPDSGRATPWPAVTPSGRDAGSIRTASVMPYHLRGNEAGCTCRQ